MPNALHNPKKISVQFWIIAIFLALVFLTGGSSRSDETPLLFLGPASLVFCAYALLTLRREHIIINRNLLIALAIIIMLAFAHVIPVPSNLRHAMADRAYLDFLNRLSNAGEAWRPLTLTPANGWHALLTLTTPAAIVFLGIQLGNSDKYRLLPLLIGFVALSGLLGLFQSISDPSGPLYLYRVTNNGSAVGLFANRNHAATLLACLFPMLAVYASPTKNSPLKQRGRKLWCAIIGTVVVPLILVTGSRSGFFMGIFGLIGAWLLYRGRFNLNPQGTTKSGSALWPGLVVLVLGFLTILFSRAEAVSRLYGETSGESRAEFVLLSTDIFKAYFPRGSGSGSFVEAYKLAEPVRLLDPSYLNHAHNDWLEIASTFGLPGALVLITCVLGYIWQTQNLWLKSDGMQRSTAFGRMASITFGITGLASLSDYPLRTPIMMSVAAVFLLWFTNGRHARSTI